MQKAMMRLILISFFYGAAFAGSLSGRIIDKNGNSLANLEIKIEGKKVKTNAFGAYKVNLKDGKRKLTVEIFDQAYYTDEITIYSPATKQNWRVDKKNKRLIKIK